MPRSKKLAAVSSNSVLPKHGKFWLAGDAPWGGFINVRVDQEQKEEFEAWCSVNPDQGWVILTDVLNEGMKVGFAYDAENECYIITFTGALVYNSTERYCVTSRAGTIGETIALAGWKHAVLIAGNYGDLRANGRLSSWG